MFPIVFAMVVAYMLVRRGGENAMWLARKDGTDPPSFRRWQERQKRRGTGGSVTGRAEGRKFWAHLWHDAHASAHEWRQRRYGRAWEGRRRKWQKQDVERQKEQPLAPCVFCGAERGRPCRPDCPERAAHDANRANGGASTVPPEQGSTEPTRGTEPSQSGPTVPPAPSQPGGTMPPDRATPDQATEPDPADTDQATVPPNSSTGNASADEVTDTPPTESNGVAPPTPITKYRPGASERTDSTINGTTAGGNVTAPNVTGEIAGYESVLAEHDQTLAHLEEVHADADRKVHAFEQLDAVYENRINGLRQANADEETIGSQVTAREANETQISAAKAQLEASSVHLEAETAARARWVAGQGAMKETADATGAEGDRVLRS